jgi:putative MATE family efflux protein
MDFPVGRGLASQRDWTKGSIIGNLLSLAWPMMAGGSLDMLGPTIDMIWVGRLGAASIAGVGVSGMVTMLVQSMMMGLYMGLRAMVARFVGAGDVKGANHVAQQSLVINVIYSITMALIGIFLADHILLLMGVEPDVIVQGVPYLRIQFVGMVTMSFRRMSEATMQASGDSVRPMFIAIFYRLFHIVLCPFLVFGWWIFPQLGVSGAALTNVFSQGIGAVLGMWFLFGGKTRLQLTLRNFRLDPSMIWRLVKLALPASVTAMERTLGNLVLIWFMTPFGTLAVAAHTINQRVEMFIHTPAMALGQAAGVLAGQNLGANQPSRAEKTGWIGAGFLGGIMLIVSLAVFLCAENLIHIFSSDPELIRLAGIFLRIACAGYFTMGITAALQQCVNGAGDTLIPMIIMLLNMWIVQVPLAYFLPRMTGLGVYGVRWAIIAGATTAALIYALYFRLGRWKYKKV